MVALPLGSSAYERRYGRMPELVFENRFFEEDPTNLVEGSALLSRPGTSYYTSIGAGPIRGMYTQAGVLTSDLFVASGNALYRHKADTTTIGIAGTLDLDGTVQMVAVSGADYEHLFVADGTNLQFYPGPSYAAGTLTHTPGTIADDIVQIDGVYYQFAADPTSDPSADGSMSNPWQVDVGADDEESLANLLAAINLSGTAGTTYSSGVTAHPTVQATGSDATTMSVRARSGGTAGNSISTTVTDTGGSDGLAWGATTLENGGGNVLYGVATPDDVGIVSVAALNGFVLCVVAQSDRVYFTRPGETTIDPLDFFTAEKQGDELIEAITIGDQVWLIGQTTLEPWALTGQASPVFGPIRGRIFARGGVEGTAVVVNEEMIMVGDDEKVYAVASRPRRISSHGIEERIRLALAAEREAT